MSGRDMVTELFLSFLLSPSGKSTPGRNHFSSSERNAVHPNTASRNNLPPEQFPHHLRIWPNTFFFFFFFKWNLLQLCYCRHGMALSVSSTAELLPDSQEGKEPKIKVKLSTLIMVADLKSSEKEHQAAGSRQKRHRFPHSAYSCQPVLVSAAYNL